MNKHYFRWLLSKYLAAVIFCLLVSLIFAISMNSGKLDSSQADSLKLYASSLSSGFAMCLLAAYVLPVVLFAFVHKRSSADLFFALPVKRKDMLFTNLLFAFCVTSLMLVIEALTGWFMRGIGLITFGHVLLLILVGCILLAAVLMVNMAFFLSANGTFDGIVMMLAYSLLPVFAAGLIQIFTENIIAGATFESYQSLQQKAVYLSPVGMSYEFFRELLWKFTGYHSYLLTPISSISWSYFITVLVWCVVAWFSLQYSFVKRRSERAGHISDNFFAYPLVIHIYLFMALLAIWCASASHLLLTSLMLVVYIAAIFVYHRTFSISPRTILTYAVIALVCCGIAKAGMATKGFGLAEKYPLGGDGGIGYEYSTGDESKDVGFSLYLSKEEMVQYGDIVALLEDCRKDSIAWFYEPDRRYDDSMYLSNLNVYDYPLQNQNHTKYSGRYSYDCRKVLNVEELKKINEITPVVVFDYNTGSEESLEEYLEKHPDFQ